MRPAGAKSSDMRMPTFAHTCPVSGFQFFLRAGRFNPHDIIATRAVSGQTTAFFIFESGELCPYIFSAVFALIFFPQFFGSFPRSSLAYRIFHAAEKNPLFPRQHHLFLLQMQMPQNQRNKPIFIIAISCATHWLSTYFMALYAL